MQPAGLPCRTTGPWGRHNLIRVNPPRDPLSPQNLDYRQAGTRVKDASGAASAAGLRPVL
jgi:hypothetical protein